MDATITVKVTEKGIWMDGHAGHYHDGQDIVCAAVSALTCSLINSLEELTDNRIRAETGSGRMEITWEDLSEDGRLLVDSWFLGISAVNQNYNCITYV